MDELLKIEPSFNKEMFITKVNNIFIMLHTSIMTNNLNRVRHFISNDLESKYETILEDLNNRKLRQMYDELNVKSTQIQNIEIVDNKIIINVLLISRYMDYLVNKDTGEFVSGINDRRIEKNNYLVFEKIIGNNYNGVIRKCPNCGASIDVNNSGQCKYCHSIFDTENHDWILTSIKEY